MSFLISDYFDLDKIEKIKESKTKVHFYTHKKTKAQVLFFENANENCGFSTFFKTPCDNSKGTTHILEHSVFEGSKKYDQENSLDFILNNSLNSSHSIKRAESYLLFNRFLYVFFSKKSFNSYVCDNTCIVEFRKHVLPRFVSPDNPLLLYFSIFI